MGEPIARGHLLDYVVTSVPIMTSGTTVAAALELLRRQRFESTEHVLIADTAGRFVGAVALTDIFSASAEAPIGGLTAANVAVVSAEADREDAASTAVRSGIAALAVCDSDGRLLGAVTAHSLMAILRDEHLEDLHEMAGIMSKSDAAKRALQAPPAMRAFYRLPWLLVGMAGSALATYVMTSYEKALEANIVIAFFVPAIVYLADAIGTQSEAVAVRGLSLSATQIPRLVAGEIATGMLIGGVLAAVAFLAVWLSFSNAHVAATVALAIVAAGTVATSVGSFLPWAFQRMGYDPAYGSGPVGTVIQDVLSLVIYFWIAGWLVFETVGR
jgi:magnesium transporter